MIKGFYLHGCWIYEYPLAVRSWSSEDYQKIFLLLKELGMNTVMLWPVTEAIPMPLSAEDRNSLLEFKEVITEAQAVGLECWLTQCANLTAKKEIAEKPWKERHFYPFKIEVDLRDENLKGKYLERRREILSILNHADAYVTIDGDPGGYPQAEAKEFLEVLLADRQSLKLVGANPENQKLIYWAWCGWGSDWEKHGVWNEPIEPLVRPVLQELKKHSKALEPWLLLPGRSHREGFANGRVNFELAQSESLVERSVLYCYEIVEFEPTAPAFVLQFDLIRTVVRQESQNLPQARGWFANAQQPIIALHNLFLFSRGTDDLNYLNKTDDEILTDFCDFMGADREIYLLAWKSLELTLESLPLDLPEKIKKNLPSSAASKLIPGGPAMYADFLAEMVRLRILCLKTATVEKEEEIAKAFADALLESIRWWKKTGYVYSGEYGDGFRFGYIHSKIIQPFLDWAQAHSNLLQPHFEEIFKEVDRRHPGLVLNLEPISHPKINAVC